LDFEDQDAGGALLFSQSDRIDEQDSILGMDAYSISTQDGATVYGGVEHRRPRSPSPRRADSGMTPELALQPIRVAGPPSQLGWRLRHVRRPEFEPVVIARVPRVVVRPSLRGVEVEAA
jgi:hypothetical protein